MKKQYGLSLHGINQQIRYLDKDLSFHKVYYAEECLQPSEYIA